MSPGKPEPTPEEQFAAAARRQERIHQDTEARRRAYARFRAPDPVRRSGRLSGGPAPCAGLLKAWMKRSGLASGARQGELASAWSGAVGPEIAEKTRVAGLRARVLTIEVDGAPLRSELAAFHAQALLDTLREAVPAARLSKIVFRLSPGRS